MGLVECCDRCLTGRRPVKEYRLGLTTAKPSEIDSTDCMWGFTLCDEHLKSLKAGISRLITPPVKQKKKE